MSEPKSRGGRGGEGEAGASGPPRSSAAAAWTGAGAAPAGTREAGGARAAGGRAEREPEPGAGWEQQTLERGAEEEPPPPAAAATAAAGTTAGRDVQGSCLLSSSSAAAAASIAAASSSSSRRRRRCALPSWETHGEVKGRRGGEKRRRGRGGRRPEVKGRWRGGGDRGGEGEREGSAGRAPAAAAARTQGARAPRGAGAACGGEGRARGRGALGPAFAGRLRGPTRAHRAPPARNAAPGLRAEFAGAGSGLVPGRWQGGVGAGSERLYGAGHGPPPRAAVGQAAGGRGAPRAGTRRAPPPQDLPPAAGRPERRSGPPLRSSAPLPAQSSHRVPLWVREDLGPGASPPRRRLSAGWRAQSACCRPGRGAAETLPASVAWFVRAPAAEPR